MRTIFAIFDSYADADNAIKQLRQQGFQEGSMNLIVQETTIDNQSGINEETAPIAVTGKIGEVTLHGLDRLVGGKIPMMIPGVGRVISAGSLGNTLARTAAAPDEVDGGLVGALEMMDVSKEAAIDYSQGVLSGDLLFFIHASDERSPQATAILKRQKAKHVTAVIPNGKEM